MSRIVDITSELFGDLLREHNHYIVRATYAIVFLTYRCTSRCKTCNIWKRTISGKDELSWDEWEKILFQLRDYGIKTIEIFGGDALLRKDVIFKMIEFSSKNNIKTYFPTNSILLDKETAKNLVEAGLDTLYFSLDDIAYNNDQIRGVSDTFSKIKTALENVITIRGASKTPHIIICTTISKMNYNHFEDIVRFLSNYPIDAIYPRVLGEFSQDNIDSSSVDDIVSDPFFVSTEDKSHLLSRDELFNLKKTFADLEKQKSAGLPYINFRAFSDTDESLILHGNGPIKKCLLCSTVVILNPNGNVTPCLFFKDYILGNLTKDNLNTIWGNGKHRKFIFSQKNKKIKICKNCILRLYYPTFSKTLSYYIKKKCLPFINNFNR